MMKKIFTYTLILVLLLTLTGCWGKRETENLAITTAIGVDQLNTGGKVMYKLSAVILHPGNLGMSSKGSTNQPEQSYVVVETQGQSLEEIVENLNTKIPRLRFLAHAQVIVLGQSVCEGNLNEVLDYLLRYPPLRLRSKIYVAKGNASEVLQAKPTMESDIGKEIYGLGGYGKTLSYGIQEITIKDFTKKVITPGIDAWAPVLEVSVSDKLKKENNLIINGLALFKAEKLGGWLNNTDTHGFALTKGEAKQGSLTVSIADLGQIACLFNEKKAKISVQIDQEKRITVDIIVKLSGELVESGAYPLNNLEDIQLAETTLNQTFEEQIRSAFKQAQESESDIFGIGRLVEIKDQAVWDSIKEQWPEMYSEVAINVKADSTIKRTGLTNKTINGKLKK
jgi:spore germination protein KC